MKIDAVPGAAGGSGDRGVTTPRPCGTSGSVAEGAVGVPPEAGAELRTRERVRQLVSEQGPISAVDAARELGLTPTAVRRHLEALTDVGVVASHRVASAGPRGRGRPAKQYVVTDAGHRDLPSAYDDLATAALGYLESVAGREAVREFARTRADELAGRLGRRLGSTLPAAEDMLARVEVIAEGLREDGYAATVRPLQVDGIDLALQLCQGHCPVHETAREYPELCEAETEAFSRLLGVHVQRLATLAHGEHVCTTRIPLRGRAPHAAGPGGGQGPGPDADADSNDNRTDPGSARVRGGKAG